MKATRSLDDSNFGAISRGGGAFAADGLSSTHTGHTLEPAMLLPVGSKRCFCRGFVPGYIHRRPAIFMPRWTPPVNTTLSPHPLGSLELAAGPHRHHGHTATAYRAVHLARLTAIFTAKVPSSHSPQGCLAWAWPAHPFDSLSALVTGPRLMPGPCPTPFGARRSEEEVCVCVCVGGKMCMCVCVLCLCLPV